MKLRIFIGAFRPRISPARTPSLAAAILALTLLSGGLLFAEREPAAGDRRGAGNSGKKAENRILVQARRMEQASASNSTASVTVVDVEKFRGRYQSLDELLEKETSVRVNRYGGQGSYSTLSIRGSNANQVNLYIDGIPLNNAAGGEVNLSDFSLDGLSKIEIYRSGAYQSSIGGAVNLVTSKKNKIKKGTRLTAQGGSYQSVALAAKKWDSTGPLKYNLSLKAEQSDQDFLFRNDGGTPVTNKMDDFDDRRKNAAFKNVFSRTILNYKYGRNRFTFLNDFSKRRQGVPGSGSQQTEKTNREYLRNTAGLAGDSKGLFYDWFRLKSRIYYTELQDQFEDYRQEFSFAEPGQHSRLQQFGLHLEPIFYLLKYNQEIKVFLAIQREIYHAAKENRFGERTEKTPTKFRNQSIFRIEDKFSFLKGRLKFTPALEFQKYDDRYNDEENQARNENFGAGHKSEVEMTNYRISALYLPVRTKQHRFFLKAAGATGKRMPLFLELFGERGSVVGNSDLKPEQADTLEGGLGYMRRGKFWKKKYSAGASFTVYRRNVEDMILFVPNSQFTMRPENVDAARITGVEFSLKFDVLERFKGGVNYTYQRAVNQSNVTYLKGKFLPLRPLHEIHQSLAYYNNFVESGLDVHYVGAVFKDRSNEYSNYQEARWIYNVYFKWSLYGKKHRKKELLLGLEIKNILDTRVSDIVGYPLPGRSVYGTVSYRF